ncbi:MAG TPA: hypothetical protein VHD62_06515 [Opitutaceae bacterium]|nr:hypothetical protein [Opitutaceae bacterium]
MNCLLVANTFLAEPSVQFAPRAVATIIIVGRGAVRFGAVQNEFAVAAFFVAPNDGHGLGHQINHPLALFRLRFEKLGSTHVNGALFKIDLFPHEQIDLLPTKPGPEAKKQRQVLLRVRLA